MGSKDKRKESKGKKPQPKPAKVYYYNLLIYIVFYVNPAV